MGTFIPRRRLVALAAAYVIALQTLLLPLSAAIGGAFDASLCTGARSVGDPPGPGRHDGLNPCAIGCGTQCCVQTIVEPQTVAFRFSLVHAIAMTPAAEIAPVLPSAGRVPQVPRAPPG